jgi:hypothetical protein
MMTENARQKLRLSPHGARTRELIPPYAMVGMFPYNAHAWTVPKLVSDLERRVLAARQWLQDNHWDPLVEAFLKDKVLAEGVYMPEDPNIRHAAQMTVQEVAAHDVWTRQRVVFDIHPGLTKHLRTSDSDKFPPMVLQHLTHPNPFVYLSEPVPMKDAVGKPVRVLGWYVVGMTRDSQYTDTTDEQAHAFHLTVISEVLSEDGKEVRDWDYCRITLPINGADATVGELVSRAMDSFNWDPSIPGQTQEGQQRYMRDLLHTIVPHLLYLVSQNLETKPKPFTAQPLPKRNKWDRRQGGGPVQRQMVGYSSGPSLAAITRWGDEKVEEKGARGPQGERRQARAHVRRAHFHTYWAGKGSKEMTPQERQEHAEKRVKWVAPVLVNADASPVATTTVKVK